MDNSYRLVFSDIPVSVKAIQLQEEWQKLKKSGDYEPVIQEILGQVLAALYLMVDDMPQAGKYRLQFASHDFKKLLLVEVTHEGTMRGIVRWDDEIKAEDDFVSLFSQMNLSFMMIPENHKSEPQQSLVALKGKNVAECLGHFLSQSTQQLSKLYLYADKKKISGLLIQKMPDDSAEANTHYKTIEMYTDTLTHNEMQSLSIEDVTHRLFHEYSHNLYQSEMLPTFRCSCSQDKVKDMVKSLGQTEAEEALKANEEHKIVAHCEFCNTKYTLNKSDIAELFSFY